MTPITLSFFLIFQRYSSSLSLSPSPSSPSPPLPPLLLIEDMKEGLRGIHLSYLLLHLPLPPLPLLPLPPPPPPPPPFSSFSPFSPLYPFSPLTPLLLTEGIKEGLKADFHQLDITSKSSIEDFVKFMQEKYKKCNILCNNAGIYQKDWTEEAFKKTMATNFIGIHPSHPLSHLICIYLGPVDLTRAMLPLIQAAEKARIINVSSGFGNLSYPSLLSLLFSSFFYFFSYPLVFPLVFLCLFLMYIYTALQFLQGRDHQGHYNRRVGESLI